MENRPQIDPEEIIIRICRMHGVQPHDIRSSNRHQDVVAARRDIVGVMRRLTILSYPAIARYMGRKSWSGMVEQFSRWERLDASYKESLLKNLLDQIDMERHRRQ